MKAIYHNKLMDYRCNLFLIMMIRKKEKIEFLNFFETIDNQTF